MAVRPDELTWGAEPRVLPEVDREESVWIARARQGEEAGYAWLLNRYRDRVIRLAAHVLRRPSEAEDAAQEAFVRAFRNLGAYRGDGPFYTWLYRIVVRVCLERRRLARWNAEQPLDRRLPEACDESESADTRILVERLLDQLSPPMRAALVLRELEGLEYEEIARVLEIPVGTVRSRLSAARERFREMWQAAMREVEHV